MMLPTPGRPRGNSDTMYILYLLGVHVLLRAEYGTEDTPYVTMYAKQSIEVKGGCHLRFLYI